MGMGLQTCSVCKHADVGSIDVRLASGGKGNSYRDIEADYGKAFTRGSIGRHKKNCVPEREPIIHKMPEVMRPEQDPELVQMALKYLPAQADLGAIAHEMLEMQYQNTHAVHSMVIHALTPKDRAFWAQKSSDVVSRTIGIMAIIRRMELGGADEGIVKELQGIKDAFAKV